jgi:hypothetical protein
MFERARLQPRRNYNPRKNQSGATSMVTPLLFFPHHDKKFRVAAARHSNCGAVIIASRTPV